MGCVQCPTVVITGKTRASGELSVAEIERSDRNGRGDSRPPMTKNREKKSGLLSQLDTTVPGFADFLHSIRVE